MPLITGTNGDDTLLPSGGRDTLDGGTGFDLVDYRGATDLVVDLARGTESSSNSTLISIEGVLAGAGDDILRGDDGGNLLDGGAGDDFIEGLGGNDTLIGGPGSNYLDGGTGYDLLDLSRDGHRGDTVALRADGSVLLTHGSQTDTLRNVEEVQFADGRLIFAADAPAAQVYRLYQAALGRAPDQRGLDAWTGYVEAGASLKTAAADFLASAEFQARFGAAAGPDDAAFVEQLYQNVLHRASDPAGKAAWTAALASHALDRSEVVLGFSESAENKANTAPSTGAGIWLLDETAAQVARLYDAVLGRLPDLDGLNSWKAQLLAGSLDLKGMTSGFMASVEFQQQFGGVSDAAFVSKLYEHTLHRAPDQAGLDQWTAWLADHTFDRADVVLGFSESAEHIANTAPNIMSSDPAAYGILFA